MAQSSKFLVFRFDCKKQSDSAMGVKEKKEGYILSEVIFCQLGTISELLPYVIFMCGFIFTG